MEGLSHRGELHPSVLIVPPNPEEGAGMDHPVSAEIAWAAATTGFPTLRFNFRGTGASQGSLGNAQSRLADAEAALRLLAENTGWATAVAVSLGGSASTVLRLQSLHPSVVAVCLINPRDLSLREIARLAVPLLVVTGADDRSQPRTPLASSIAEAGGTMEVIEGADANFRRNLPEVGRAVVHFLKGATSVER